MNNADCWEDVDFEGAGSEQKLYERFRIKVDKGQGLLRIDKFLTNMHGGVSRTRFKDAADAGFITVNGASVKSNYRIKPDDEIVVWLDRPPISSEIVPQNIPLDIVWEDDQILLVNKQADLVVHPGVGNHDNTLLNAIAYHLKDNKNFDANNPNLGLVHRIDKDTSGLILIAKDEYSKTFLGKQFQNKTTQRKYEALVWGVLKDDFGTVDGALMRNPKDRMQFVVADQNEFPLAKHAVTHYKALRRYSYATHIECRLETGRTHQIRVHMKHIGHTLFNDVRYGGNEILKGNRTASYKRFIENCFVVCNRQALHAKTLGFVHPKTEKEMFFEIDLPSDFKNLLNKWEKYSPHNNTMF